ncbi:hypothetical protein [Actinoplanes regularis]|uniref:hypothetical protein n=1 Tax=Actinoplanes regularis TaxID=52697 RepID=UPI0024A1D7CA|nr:hypothetical protein [Actinoplanes regularis]GLW30992.1 hypothetical protein Areg01_39320 [Actinoplanes regularis]
MHFSWIDRETTDDDRDWIVRQYAAMFVHGPTAVIDSAEYSMAIDFLETYPKAQAVFEALLRQVPPAHYGPLLRSSQSVFWDVKRGLYEAAAQRPELHDALGHALSASFYAVYGMVDVIEAAELFRRITVTDGPTREGLLATTTRPMPMSSGSAIIVTDPDWQRPDYFLLEMAVTEGPRRWRSGSELLLDGRVRGHLMHWRYPFPGKLAHVTLPGRTLKQHSEFHLIKADPSEAADLVDRDFELWLPGLREYVAGQANNTD